MDTLDSFFKGLSPYQSNLLFTEAFKATKQVSEKQCNELGSVESIPEEIYSILSATFKKHFGYDFYPNSLLPKTPVVSETGKKTKMESSWQHCWSSPKSQSLKKKKVEVDYHAFTCFEGICLGGARWELIFHYYDFLQRVYEDASDEWKLELFHLEFGDPREPSPSRDEYQFDNMILYRTIQPMKRSSRQFSFLQRSISTFRRHIFSFARSRSNATHSKAKTSWRYVKDKDDAPRFIAIYIGTFYTVY